MTTEAHFTLTLFILSHHVADFFLLLISEMFHQAYEQIFSEKKNDLCQYLKPA